MSEVTTIGVDLAKNVFQVHGVDVAGEIVIRRQLRRPPGIVVLPEAAAVSCWHGSVRHIALLGA